jgi:carbonic anhydrase
MKLHQISASICFSLFASAAAWAEDAPHFGYSGDHGPEHWADLSADWSACAAGKSQSPIDIADAVDEELPALDINYVTGSQNFVNNGHAVQVNYAAGSTLADDGGSDGLGSTFELKQFHFHSPSEHQRNGKNLSAEIHLVHADASGNLAVVAMLVDEGAANPVIAKLWGQMPGAAGTSNAAEGINVADLLPSDRSHFVYSGSLTTPPCSEGVHWIMMKEPVTMSREQVGALKKGIGFSNNRPVQPLNGREIAE